MTNSPLDTADLGGIVDAFPDLHPGELVPAPADVAGTMVALRNRDGDARGT